MILPGVLSIVLGTNLKLSADACASNTDLPDASAVFMQAPSKPENILACLQLIQAIQVRINC